MVIKFKTKQLFSIFFALVLTHSFIFTGLSASINTSASGGYNLPYEDGTRALITQSCIDGYSSDSCIHSGFYSKRYSVDFSCRGGGDIPIVSITDGEIIESGYDAYGYGYYVKVLNTDDTVALYAHFKYESNAQGVVKKGQPIGICGSTGNSTGAHLHLELRPSRYTKDTTPIIFNECFVQECINGQVKFGTWYTSANKFLGGTISYDYESIDKTECITENNTLVTGGNVLIDKVFNCFQENGLIDSSSEKNLLVDGLDMEGTSYVKGSGNLCDQLINYEGYKIGQQNSTIYNLQECLIKDGYLEIAKPTYYYGLLTKNAIDKARVSD